jgi:phosphate-selective porin
VEYAVNEDLSLFGRYDYLKFSLDLPVPLDIPDDRLRAKSFAIGAGYQATKNLRVNADYHLVDGKAFLNGAENPGIDDDGGEEWSMLMVMGSVA